MMQADHDKTPAQLIAELTELRSKVEMLERSHGSIVPQEQPYQALAEMSPVGLFWTDAAGKTLYVNDQFCQMAGISATEFYGGGWVEALHADDRDRVVNHWFDTAREERSTFQSEFRFQHRDGTIFWVFCQAVAQTDEAGAIVKYVGTATDITAIKLAETELKQQSERQRLVTEMAQKIRESLRLEEILNTTVAEVRQFLNTDRVIIVQFDEEWHCRVMVESVGEQWMPLLSMNLYDPCFGQDYVQPFRAGLITAKENIHTANIDPCHVNLLTSFQVKANLVVPILQDDNLWGLLIAHHCSAPRPWLPSEVDLLRQLGLQVGIAIQQSTLFEKVQVELAERKRTAEALRQSEERWQLAIEASNDGIWDHNLIDNTHFLSKRCLELVGYADYEVNLFETWAQYIHPDDMNSVFEAFQRHLDHQTPYYIAEYRMRCKDGAYKWIQSRGKALWDERGVPVRAVGSLTDISDRVLAEAERKASELQIRSLNAELEQRVIDRTMELQDSEERFRSAFDHAAIGMALIQVTGRWMKVNPTLCEILGYGETELLRMTSVSVTDPLDQVQHQHYLNELLSDKARSQQFEQRDRHKLGHIVWVRMSLSLVRNSQGQPLYFVAQIQDITESRAIEQIKSEFISIVSHELRTPLTSIRGSLGLLATGVLDNEPKQMHRMIEIAATDTERLVRLVNDILDLDRLESGKVPLLRETHQPMDLIQRSIEVMQASAQAAQVRLEGQLLDGTLSPVWADSDRIIQTLTNLISNAIKFSPAETTVRVTAQLGASPSRDRIDPHVLFCVEDQGRGIPSEKLETIFGRFQQVDASDARQKGGTGLGLAICRTIVNQHSGKIWAESTIGQGTTFFFTLPISHS